MSRKTVIILYLGAIGLVWQPAVLAEEGRASFYHDKFQGRLTACGQKFSQKKLTAAHKKLPCGTKVQVTHRDTGESVVVTINDRGPFVKGRVIDLSKAAAQQLGFGQKKGIVPVELEVVGE